MWCADGASCCLSEFINRITFSIPHLALPEIWSLISVDFQFIGPIHALTNTCCLSMGTSLRKASSLVWSGFKFPATICIFPFPMRFSRSSFSSFLKIITADLNSIHPLHVGATQASSGEVCKAPEGWMAVQSIKLTKPFGRGGVGFCFFNKFSRPTLSGPWLAPYSFKCWVEK